MSLIELRNIYKIYGSRKGHIALKDINISIDEGEFISIMGPSGSGKTTLINILSINLKPSAGELIIGGRNCIELNSLALSNLKKDKLSFIFQDFKLINTLTVKENLIFPKILRGEKSPEINECDMRSIRKLGIENILHKYIDEISGGQVQKVAIARAIISNSDIVFADEPTSKLDSMSMKRVIEVFKSINRQEGRTIFMVTHDPLAASYSDRVLFLRDGEIYNEIYKGKDHKEFYESILDVISFLGGNLYEF